MDYVINMLLAGWQALVGYFTIARILSLSIAFFLSGAIAQFMSKGAIMKYFGSKANKGISYIVAAFSGVILAVCSCSVLPMFASIRKKGAGIGPAITFLFAGPAINILAITMTFSMIGFDIGAVRVVGAVILSIIIGILMSLFFQKGEDIDANDDMFSIDDEIVRAPWKNILFFITLIAILVSGVKHAVLTIILIVVLIVELILWFKKVELKEWCKETWKLVKKIVPLFIIGIFLARIITFIIPTEFIVSFVGGNTLGSNLLSATFGAFMYFATLTEIPIVTGFMSLGMSKAAATALLLAGPSLSLPNMIVIGKVLGGKKTMSYVGLVIIFSALIALLAGAIIYV